ncbi:uncharacterized protein LOC115074559 [Rhinatrema bivittatum]|uniref:uncharacterized protein LOC115074559 n=1 Tax=Rhinatrema bivittatum TaxID=194408 RepID=UPI00112D3AD2|nr:uncharacterized protein LOC115074559 [Rhinatrema bivittatum]
MENERTQFTHIFNQTMWAEEDSPYFRETHLQSSEHPAEGKTYLMFHGTAVDAAASVIQNGFRQSSEKCMLGRGVYVSRDIEKAKRYPLNRPHECVVLKLRVNVGRVKKIDRQNHPLQKTWHDKGYDTAWVPPGCGMVSSGLEEDCIWDPSRIKVVDVVIAPGYALQYLKDLVKAKKQGQNMVYLLETILQSSAKLINGKIYLMFLGTTVHTAVSIILNGFRSSNEGELGPRLQVSRDIEKAKRYPWTNTPTKMWY